MTHVSASFGPGQVYFLDFVSNAIKMVTELYFNSVAQPSTSAVKDKKTVAVVIGEVNKAQMALVTAVFNADGQLAEGNLTEWIRNSADGQRVLSGSAAKFVAALKASLANAHYNYATNQRTSWPAVTKNLIQLYTSGSKSQSLAALMAGIDELFKFVDPSRKPQFQQAMYNHVFQLLEYAFVSFEADYRRAQAALDHLINSSIQVANLTQSFRGGQAATPQGSGGAPAPIARPASAPPKLTPTPKALPPAPRQQPQLPPPLALPPPPPAVVTSQPSVYGNLQLQTVSRDPDNPPQPYTAPYQPAPSNGPEYSALPANVGGRRVTN